MVESRGKKTNANNISPKQSLKLQKKMGLNNFYLIIIVLAMETTFWGFDKPLLITTIEKSQQISLRKNRIKQKLNLYTRIIIVCFRKINLPLYLIVLLFLCTKEPYTRGDPPKRGTYL